MKLRSLLVVVLVAALVGFGIVKWRHAAPRPRFTRPGEFCLLQRASVTSARGVTGYAPGTIVRLIQDKGDTMIVQRDQDQFEIPSDTLTNSIDLAELASRRDALSQQAYFDHMTELRASYRAEQLRQNVETMKLQVEAASHRPLEKAWGGGPLTLSAYDQKIHVTSRPVIYDPGIRYYRPAGSAGTTSTLLKRPTVIGEGQSGADHAVNFPPP